MNRPISLLGAFVLLSLACCAHLPAGTDKITGKPSAALTTWGGDARDNPILNRVGRKLAEASELGTDYYQFKLILTREINAFTFSGGYIYLFLGMAEIMETEDELAAVLAHEIAHSEKRHLARHYDWEFPLHLVGGVVPLVTLGLIPNPITLALSRSKEAQADEVGLRLMAKAGYCPQGMKLLMEKFDRIFSLGTPSKYVLTHPPSKERFERINALLASMDQKDYLCRPLEKDGLLRFELKK